MTAILKGHIIPFLENEKFYNYTVLQDEDFKLYREFLGELKKFISNMANRWINEGFSEEDFLEYLADCIVAFMKAPLLLDIRGKEIEKNPAPYKIYWTWILTKKQLKDVLWNKDIKEVIRGKPLEAVIGLFRRIFSEDLHQLVFRVFKKFPADTRVGLNTSSLLVHSLAVSALAFLKGKAVGLDRKSLQILRLAALIHDLAKPIAWEKTIRQGKYISHGEEAEKLVLEILEGIINEKTLTVLKDIVRYHHDVSKLKKIMRGASLVHEADIDASSLDRLVRFIADPLSRTLGVDSTTLENMLIKSGPEVWRFWDQFPIDKLKEATEETVHLLRTYIPQDGGSLRSLKNIALGSIDLRGIQSFIGSSEDLKSLIAGSYLIDLTVIYAIPRILQEVFDLPPEAIVYTGGGMITFLTVRDAQIPKESVKKSLIKILGEELAKPLDFVISVKILYDLVYRTLQNLAVDLACRKVIIDSVNDRMFIDLGFYRKCDLCGLNPASERGLRGEFLCSTCKAKIEIGFNLSFKMLWDEVGLKPVDDSWSEAGQYIMEILAGHDDYKNPKRLLNLAIIKADGNSMGLFMANTLSITELIEKSISIDVALKRAYRELFKIVENKASPGEAKRLQLGVLYVGGDDTIAILPAWIAVPSAIILAETFWKWMGGGGYRNWQDAPTLSVAIASAHARYNIWGLIDAAEHLLDECKKYYRELRDTTKYEGKIKGLISFYFTETGIVSGSAVLSIIRDYMNKNLVKQPYTIEGPNPIGSVLKTLIGEEVRDKTEFIEVFYKAFKAAYCNKENKRVERAKRLRNFLYSVASVVRKYGGYRKAPLASYIASLYIIRESQSHENERGKLASSLRELIEITDKGVIPPPLWDLSQLIKFLGGGAI
ncbi:MAG: hypothetical protein DRJ38_07320 [Thermoprotei archaeon]|nr:MAG: hypothetical protein DRJ38_07320 [Thermoprotei archaeon]